MKIPEELKPWIDKIKRSMTNQKPTEEMMASIEDIRDSFMDLTEEVIVECGDNEYTREAVKSLETSLMYAVKAIVLEGGN